MVEVDIRGREVARVDTVQPLDVRLAAGDPTAAGRAHRWEAGSREEEQEEVEECVCVCVESCWGFGIPLVFFSGEM